MTSTAVSERPRWTLQIVLLCLVPLIALGMHFVLPFDYRSVQNQAQVHMLWESGWALEGSIVFALHLAVGAVLLACLLLWNCYSIRLPEAACRSWLRTTCLASLLAILGLLACYAYTYFALRANDWWGVSRHWYPSSIAAIVVLFSGLGVVAWVHFEHGVHRIAVAALLRQSDAPSQERPARSGQSVAARLRSLDELLVDGTLTDAEYQEQRARILSEM